MKTFNLLQNRISQLKKVDNFQRNACSGHLVFQNEANFSPREAYLQMKISCKFGEPTWCRSMCSGGIANTKGIHRILLVDTINQDFSITGQISVENGKPLDLTFS